VEYRRETNLPATSAQTDKQTWLQGAHGLEKREKSTLSPQVERTPSAYRERREVSSPGSSETDPAISKETRNPPRLSVIFTRYCGGTVSAKRLSPLFLCGGVRAPGIFTSRFFCEPERAKRGGAQPRATMDERSISEKQTSPLESPDSEVGTHRCCVHDSCTRTSVAYNRFPRRN
jgi:hypothetical protein